MTIFNRLKTYDILFTILLVVISPWFVVLVTNCNLTGYWDFQVLKINNQQLIDNINTFRGELINVGVNGLLSRMFANKLVFYGLEAMNRYFQSFDPNFLLFRGDINLLRSTTSSGVVYTSLLIAVFYYYIKVKKNTILLLVTLLLLSNTLSIFVSDNFYLPVRIPFLLVFTYMAHKGLSFIGKNNRFLFCVLIFSLLFEFSRFLHDFKTHYPQRLSESIWIVKK